MKSMLTSLVRNSKKTYVDMSYNFRHLTKWKKINNVSLCISDDQISKKILGNIVWGDYEVDENKILQKTFSADDVLLELGTGIGFNSIYCSKRNNGRVITYEGNPNLIPLIRKNMERNNTTFTLKNEIVISKDFHAASISFNIVEDFWSSSSKSTSAAVVKKVDVPTTDINAIIKKYQPTYLVTDIEGGEEDLFDNCDWLDASPIQKIMVELHADIIGEAKCFGVMRNIVAKGFNLNFDGAPKNVAFFSR